MTADIVAIDKGEIERSDDPAVYTIEVMERAKSWLAIALHDNDFQRLTAIKGQAEAIRVYTLQMNLGKDAELASAEIVRRAERCIGLAVRAGQEAGEIATRLSNNAHPSDPYERVRFGKVETVRPQAQVQTAKDRLPNAAEVTGIPMSTLTESAYALAEADDEVFDVAVEIAKEEGNLSRANVIKTVKTLEEVGTTASHTQVREEKKRRYDSTDRNPLMRGSRRLDSNRIVEQTVLSVYQSQDVLDAIEFDQLNRDHLPTWIDSLKESRRQIGQLIKGLETELGNV